MAVKTLLTGVMQALFFILAAKNNTIDMNYFKYTFLLTAVSAPLLFCGCSKDEGFNIFSIQDDVTLGLQVKDEIAAKPGEYPILDRSAYAASYAYLEQMKQTILNSGQVTHKDDFAWELYIVRDDNVQNAFCTPGGYIYIYTGLIKYLDDASSLAGVMGHEMAHADKRHSTEQMTKQYGLSVLLDVVLGKNQGMLSQIAQSLVTLQFSRTDETEADTYSVKYLCPTKYEANGAAKFFEKIEAGGGASVPEFLSTHPNPDNRISNIKNQASSGGCTSTITTTENITDYNSFKASLP